MKISVKKNKYIIAFLFLVGFIGAIFALVPGISVKGIGYDVQYGGRIFDTRTMEECLNYEYDICEGLCAFCGCGEHFQVIVQPSGGSGISFCPTFLATKGNNPTYKPGGYVITGGWTGVPAILDPNNTASVLGKNSIRGNLMLAWFRILDLFS